MAWLLSCLFFFSIAQTAGDPVRFHSHADWIDARLRHWARPVFRDFSREPIQFHSLSTPGNDRLIGAEQAMLINAPIKRVERVMDAYENYLDLSPGFKTIQVVKREGNRAWLYWERESPAFFIPNIKYEAEYQKMKGPNGRIIYRYKLSKSESLAGLDGVVIFEKKGKKTFFWRYDFIDAARGAFKAAPSGKIWSTILEDLFMSNADIKLYAENPSWSYAKVIEGGRKLLTRWPINEIIKRRSENRVAVLKPKE